MTHPDLKALAEAAITSDGSRSADWISKACLLGDGYEAATAAFVAAMTPARTLELLAENEALRGERDTLRAERDAAVARAAELEATMPTTEEREHLTRAISECSDSDAFNAICDRLQRLDAARGGR